MRRHYRGIIVALGLVLALFAVGTWAELTAISTNRTSAFPEYYETAAQTQERFPSLSPQDALKRAIKQKPCRNQNSREASELCAQWRSVNVAENAAQWAFWQLILSGFGLIGLGATLWFNFQAWAQAKSSQAETLKALEHAEASSKAMARMANTLEEQYRIVLETAKTNNRIADTQDKAVRTQLRAYISILIGEAIFQDDRLKFEARPQILNSGPTPARNVRWRIAVDILPVPLPDRYRFRLPERRNGGTIIGPGQSAFMSAVYDTRLDPSQVERIKRGEGNALYVWGYVIYEDILGKTHRTTFAQQIGWRQTGATTEDGHIPEIVHGYYLHRHNCAN